MTNKENELMINFCPVCKCRQYESIEIVKALRKQGMPLNTRVTIKNFPKIMTGDGMIIEACPKCGAVKLIKELLEK